MNGTAATPAARHIDLVAGPSLAGIMVALPPPEGLSAGGWQVAALGVLMAITWFVLTRLAFRVGHAELHGARTAIREPMPSWDRCRRRRGESPL